MHPRKKTIKELEKNGFIFRRHGASHDLYFQPNTKQTIPVKRHDFNENDIAYDYFHSLCHKMLNQEIDFDIIFQNITMDHYVIYHINCYDNYKDVLYKM